MKMAWLFTAYTQILSELGNDSMIGRYMPVVRSQTTSAFSCDRVLAHGTVLIEVIVNIFYTFVLPCVDLSFNLTFAWAW